MRGHPHKLGVKCPYCKNVAQVGRDALNCKTCGAYAVNRGQGMFQWRTSGGIIGQMGKMYDW